MLKKYDYGASKDVYKLLTGGKSWIYVYELETKQQSTVWVFQDEPNPATVGHVATALFVERKMDNTE